MTPGRQLAYDFMNLPYHVKLKVLRDLGLIITDTGDSTFVDAFQCAREQEKIEALTAAVKDAHAKLKAAGHGRD